MLPVMFSVCHHHAEITTNRHYGTSRPDMTEKLLTGTLQKKKERKREKNMKNKKEKQVTIMISCPGEATSLEMPNN